MATSILTRDIKACFQLKTSFAPCTILQILHYDLKELDAQLKQTVRRSPTFFLGAPIIIDLDHTETFEPLDFIKIKEILLANNLVPIGVRGGNTLQQTKAASYGLPLLMIGKLAQQKEDLRESQTDADSKENSSPAIPETLSTQTKLITTPIRSGMRVYAKNSDLIVTASVSHGAELLADGHIHVYGHLRGRALAGVLGNKNARIFCHHLEAELVSIAGYYLTKEEIEHLPHTVNPLQIYLNENEVKIEPFL